MAGGPHAAVVMCMLCGRKAVRVYEGYEDDHYRCETCGEGFGLDWSRNPPTAPCWPPSAEELEMMKKFLAEEADAKSKTSRWVRRGTMCSPLSIRRSRWNA